MKIQQLPSNKNKSIIQPKFKGLHVIDTDLQKLLLTSLKPKQLDALSGFIKEQQNNSVHILLSSKNGKRLEASFYCAYRLQDFKTKYKQRFLLESKFDFIKRIVNAANEYKKQIQSLEVCELKWNYDVLLEWAHKMLSNNNSNSQQ